MENILENYNEKSTRIVMTHQEYCWAACIEMVLFNLNIPNLQNNLVNQLRSYLGDSTTMMPSESEYFRNIFRDLNLAGGKANQIQQPKFKTINFFKNKLNSGSPILISNLTTPFLQTITKHAILALGVLKTEDSQTNSLINWILTYDPRYTNITVKVAWVYDVFIKYNYKKNTANSPFDFVTDFNRLSGFQNNSEVNRLSTSFQRKLRLTSLTELRNFVTNHINYLASPFFKINSELELPEIRNNDIKHLPKYTIYFPDQITTVAYMFPIITKNNNSTYKMVLDLLLIKEGDYYYPIAIQETIETFSEFIINENKIISYILESIDGQIFIKWFNENGEQIFYKKIASVDGRTLQEAQQNLATNIDPNLLIENINNLNHLSINDLQNIQIIQQLNLQ